MKWRCRVCESPSAYLAEMGWWAETEKTEGTDETEKTEVGAVRLQTVGRGNV